MEAQQPPVGKGLLSIHASRSHLDTSHPIGLLCTSDQPDAETTTWQQPQNSQETDIHAPGEIRTRNSSKCAATDPPLRPRGHWSQLAMIYYGIKLKCMLRMSGRLWSVFDSLGTWTICCLLYVTDWATGLNWGKISFSTKLFSIEVIIQGRWCALKCFMRILFWLMSVHRIHCCTVLSSFPETAYRTKPGTYH